MYKRTPTRYASASISLILVGLFLGNKVFMASGVLVLVYLGIGLSVQQPSGVIIEILHGDADVYVDELFEFRYRIRVQNGTGLVTLGFKVPDLFKLVEGNNFDAFWKGTDPVDRIVSFKVRCEKRGEYRLEGAKWETRHTYGFTLNDLGEVKDGTVLVVRPKHSNVRRIRDRKMFSKMPMPTEALILMGVPTTTFREIREYRVGDPFKSINWKATARSMYSSNRPIMVNEYEKEGRKTVWIFLNTATRMQTGTTVHNCFEYAVQSVLELVDFYISKDSVVGLALYSDDDNPKSQAVQNNKELNEILRRRSILPPDTGSEQLNRVKEMMMRVRQSSLNPDLVTQVGNIKRYAQGINPLFILVTIIDEESADKTLTGITEMSRLSRRGRRQNPVLVVHIVGYELVGVDKNAARLRSMEDRATLNRLTSSADVIQWNPVLQGLNEAIIQQVRR